MTAVFNFTNGGNKYCLKPRFLADFKNTSRVSDELT